MPLRLSKNLQIDMQPNTEFTLLCVNLGNADLKYFNDRHRNKLVSRRVEGKIARRIAHLSPDIVVYQESIGHLEYTGRDPLKPQIRRLLGDEYSIIADNRFQFEGIAVKRTTGIIEGVEPGAYAYNPRTEIQGGECDDGFASQVVTIVLGDGTMFELAAFHLHSLDVYCRARVLRSILGNVPTPSKLKSNNVVLAGDFNFDPWRFVDPSIETWHALTRTGWQGRPFHHHNHLAADGLPELTSQALFLNRTIDFVLSNFLIGTVATLGTTPGTQRLDGGSGCDHRALFGNLSVHPN